MMTTSVVPWGQRVESWADSLYDDLKGFIFGHSTTTPLSPTRTATATAGFDAEASSSIAAALTTAYEKTHNQYYATHTSAVPSVAAFTHTASAASTAGSVTPPTLLEPTSSPLPAYTSSLVPNASPVAHPEHTDRVVNQNTFLLILLGATIAAAIFLLAPVVVRLGQFGINALKLLLCRKGSFSRDSEMGLTSETFSLTGNIESADARQGLDKKAKMRVMWYMLRYGEQFDEARLRYVLHQFAKNGIGPDGQPLDPKFISYSSDN